MIEIAADRRRSTTTRDPRMRWLQRTARVGYLARGIVYLALGVAAVALAVGLAEQPRGITGVLRVLVRLPLGEVLLAGLAGGFVGYALLNFAGAVLRRGVGLSSRLVQVADAVTGALYIAFAAGAVRVIAQPRGTGGRQLEAMASSLLGVPGGRLLLGAGGIVVAACGAALCAKAFRSDFGERLDRRLLSPPVRRLVDQLARAGTCARGLLFIVSGLLAAWAAVAGSPAHVGDLGDALAAIARTALGPVLVAVIGVCLAGYGAYQLVKVRYRVILDLPE